MHLTTRSVFSGLLAASLGLLSAGLVLGELVRLQPCYLCNLQRLLYMVLAFFALCGVLWPRWSRLWSVLVAAAAGGGLSSALQQSWMQYAPQQVTECGFGDPTLAEQLINWLGVQWPAMFMVTGFCTQTDWVFLGLSLANWSAVCFFALLATALWLLLRRQSAG